MLNFPFPLKNKKNQETAERPECKMLKYNALAEKQESLTVTEVFVHIHR